MKQHGTSDGARIEELETRIAHQDHSILELGHEVYRQQRQISQLESMVRHLADRLQPIELAHTARASADEVPPHY